MTTQTQDTNAQQRAPDDAPVAGGPDAAADNTQTGAMRAAAEQSMPTLGGLQAVCRAVVKRLFGKRHWAAPWALELCAADAQFLPHLAEQPRGYAHFLCLIRMALLERGAGGEAQEVARSLRADGKRMLLKKFMPYCRSDIIDLLPKLPKKPFHADGYRALIDALEDSSVRWHLSRNERVSLEAICFFSSIENIPTEFRAAAIRLFNIEEGDEYDDFSLAYFEFLQIIRVIEKFNLKVTAAEFHGAVDKAVNGSSALGVRELENWVMEKISALPFPPPPWEGNDKIRPIRSLDEWESVAAKFDLAGTRGMYTVKDYPSRIVAGYEYHYVCDHIPAMVMLRHGAYHEWCVAGWAIRVIHGKKNRRIGLLQEYEIRQMFHQFLDAGIHPEPIYRETHYCH